MKLYKVYSSKTGFVGYSFTLDNKFYRKNAQENVILSGDFIDTSEEVFYKQIIFSDDIDNEFLSRKFKSKFKLLRKKKGKING